MDYEKDTFDWDEEIEDDGAGFILFEPGKYDFRVKAFERGETKRGDAKMAILEIELSDGNGNKTTIKDYIVLKRSVEWKISSFFRALGMKKHGEKIKMDWNGSVGKTGRCEVIVEEYTGNDGKTYKNNKINKYFDKSASAEPNINKLPDPWDASDDGDDFSWD